MRRASKVPSFSGAASLLVEIGEYIKSGGLFPSPVTIGDWQQIEQAYGESISPQVRDAIVRVTQMFVVFEESERKGESVADTHAVIETCRKRAREFQDALPSLKSSDDAVGFLLKDFDPQLLATLYYVLPKFCDACDSALTQLSEYPAVKEGEEWDLWIRKLIKICGDAELPVTASKGSKKPSSFVMLVQELQKVLPRECRRHMFSYEALATAITRARQGQLVPTTKNKSPLDIA